MSLPFRELARQAAGPLIGRCTFAEGPGPLACAVSGGADSLALLVLAVAADRDAVAHHVDHGLRAGSCEDVHVVNEVASALGVTVVVHRVAVDDGSNLEARARAARLTVLPAGAATGHTADDQAETVLLNLLRGAATDGLAAMRAGGRHPILGLRRAETHELCAQLGLDPVQDPTNRDPAHLRNRVRHELLPVLCELAGRDVVPILARQARLMADDATLLDDLAASARPDRRPLHRRRPYPARPAGASRVAPLRSPAGLGDGRPGAVGRHRIVARRRDRLGENRPSHAWPAAHRAGGRRRLRAAGARGRAGPSGRARPAPARSSLSKPRFAEVVSAPVGDRASEQAVGTDLGLMSKPPAALSVWDADPALGRVVVSVEQIAERVAELGETITADYAGRPPLLVGVLKGAFIFLADLARAIRLPLELDFMAVSSYGTATKTSGVVRIVKDLDIDLTGRHVLIVEDILDSGLTLSYLRKSLQARGPASLAVCSLLVKRSVQPRPDLEIAYVGFEIEPEFVVGYGLDVAERYRNLPDLRVYVAGEPE